MSAEGTEQHIVTVDGLEQFRKKVDTAHTGENIAVLVRGITRDEVQSGMIITDNSRM
jgi:elongation factor Tu